MLCSHTHPRAHAHAAQQQRDSAMTHPRLRALSLCPPTPILACTYTMQWCHDMPLCSPMCPIPLTPLCPHSVMSGMHIAMAPRHAPTLPLPTQRDGRQCVAPQQIAMAHGTYAYAAQSRHDGWQQYVAAGWRPGWQQVGKHRAEAVHVGRQCAGWQHAEWQHRTAVHGVAACGVAVWAAAVGWWEVDSRRWKVGSRRL